MPDGFKVDPWLHWLGGLVVNHRWFWIRLGNIESWFLADRLNDTPIEAPIYIAGLARSGSTLLLELLERHPDIATHRYRDYPMLFTPYWWNRYLDRVPRPVTEPLERSHRDGIYITTESPEAFEEMLWMAFFPNLHDSERSALVQPGPQNRPFEKFYAVHIRKLLLIRSGRRYLSKGNYNVTRIDYLKTIFGDARFLLPVREPVRHIASSMRQHRLFCGGEAGNPRAVAHLSRVGHFEFGLQRRPIHTGNDAAVAEILDLWSRGEEVAGWARYWCLIHDHLADSLDRDPLLRESVLVVPHERLCADPAATFRKVLDHCRLTPGEDLIEAAVNRIRPPSPDIPPPLTPRDLSAIERLTAASAARFGLRPFSL